MPEHIQYEDDDLFNPETHHEESDVPVRPLWWALIIFVVFGFVTHIVLYFMYHGMVKAEKKRWEPPQTTVARPANADVPQNQPLLQPFPDVPATQTTATMREPYENTPVTDMREMRANEDRVLHNYGWVDKQHGVVRIPIEQAKTLLAAKIAVDAQRPATPASGTPASPPAEQAPSPAPSPAPAATTTTGGAH